MSSHYWPPHSRVIAEGKRVPVAELETRRVTYSYAQTDMRIFSDIEIFDEFEFSNMALSPFRCVKIQILISFLLLRLLFPVSNTCWNRVSASNEAELKEERATP